MLTGGEAIVGALEANGVNTVFGLPGVQMYALFDALYQKRQTIRTVGARHEQGSGYMALGYARSTGRPGVFTVVPGPGVLNASAALNTAGAMNAPVLCVTGQIPSSFIGMGRGHLHEMPDQLATLRSMLKWAGRIERPADAPGVINEAFRQMLTGRPGPVAVEMAWDVLGAREEVAAAQAAKMDVPPAPDLAAIDTAARLLTGAAQPMIWVGSGAVHAAKEIREIAELLGAPVTSFRGGRGIVAEDHPLSVSSYAAKLLWPNVDVVLGVGTRLELPYMRWSGNYMKYSADAGPKPRLIRMDIDREELPRLKAHVPILADAAAGTRALLEALRRSGAKSTEQHARVAKAKQDAKAAIQKVQPMVAYLDVIRSVLPRDGFFVREVNQIGFASWYAFPVYAPRTYIAEGFSGTLGYGFPTALGVKVANPDKAVVCASSDGGFLFALQELASAVQERIALVTLVFNNGAFGNVLRDQQEGFGGRVIGAELQNPDFVKLSEAFGARAYRVESPEALRPVLSGAIQESGPSVIEVVVPRGSEVSPWEFV